MHGQGTCIVFLTFSVMLLQKQDIVAHPAAECMPRFHNNLTWGIGKTCP